MEFESEWPEQGEPRKKRPSFPKPKEVIPRPAAPAAEPFNPPTEPWIGDVWRTKKTGVTVDVTDVVKIQDRTMVMFDVRRGGRARRSLGDFLEEFEALVLVEPRPVKS